MTKNESEQIKKPGIQVLLKWIKVIVISLVTIYAITLIFKPYQFNGISLDTTEKIKDFTLTNHYGEEVSLSDYEDKVVLVYFGYLACPDVCPTTMAMLRQANIILEDRSDEIQVLMISVDPERDTQEMLGEFLSHFNEDFLGLTGTIEQIREISTYFGVYFQKVDTTSTLGYLINHTADVMVIDQKGYLRLLIPFGSTGAEIAADLNYLLDH